MLAVHSQVTALLMAELPCHFSLSFVEAILPGWKDTIPFYGEETDTQERAVCSLRSHKWGWREGNASSPASQPRAASPPHDAQNRCPL